MRTKVITDLPRDIQEKYVRAVYGKWTTTPPIVEGLYFVKLVDPKRDEWAGTIQCVFVYQRDGKPYHSLQHGFSTTHWLGPIPIPGPPQ